MSNKGSDGDDDDVFPIEFRHRIVTETARGLVDGSIKIEPNFATSEKVLDDIAELHGKLTSCTQYYFSGKFKGEKLSQLEHEMFGYIARLRMLEAIPETFSTSKAETEIQRLHERIDATNDLLRQVLILLKELMKKIEDKR